MTGEKRGGVVPAGSLVDSLLRSIPAAPPAGAVSFARLVELWPTLLSDQWARITQPQGIRDGVLRVACASSAMVLNMRFAASDLLLAIQEKCPDAGVRRVVPFFGAPIGAGSWDALRGTSAREPDQPVLREPEPRTMNERIERARTAQKSWVEHMKKTGWKGCPICRKIPIRVELPACALCQYHEKRRKANARKPGPQAA
jgi:hypothetical protein